MIDKKINDLQLNKVNGGVEFSDILSTIYTFFVQIEWTKGLFQGRCINYDNLDGEFIFIFDEVTIMDGDNLHQLPDGSYYIKQSEYIAGYSNGI